MARLSKAVVEQRENFIRDFFRKDPKGTAVQAQEGLKASGIPGGMMRPGRVYELKREVTKRETTPVQATPEVQPAAEPAPAPVSEAPASMVVVNPLTGEPVEPVKA